MNETSIRVSRQAGRTRAPLRVRGAALALLAGWLSSAPAAAQDPGRQAFLDARCDRCHGVESRDIEAQKPRASDLGKVGGAREASWIRDYLLRKAETSGHEHPVAWKGSDEELETLVAWLAALR